MQFINIYDTKTNLSKYLEKVVENQDTYVICKNGKPIAQIVPYKPQKIRQLGLAKGKITISEDFDQLPEDFLKNFK